MGDFKLKLSDIFRYILLGCVEAVLCIILYWFTDASDCEQIVQSVNKMPSEQSLIALILAISAFYIIGYITQIIIRLFFRGNLMGTGIGEIACFIKSSPNCLLNKDKYPYPDWIYFSDAPDRVVETFQDITETDADSENKLEDAYACQLFQGIAFALIIFTVMITDAGHWAKAAIITLIIMAFSWLGNTATKNKRHIAANKILMLVVPAVSGLVIFLTSPEYDPEDRWFLTGLLVPVLMLASLFFAASLSRRQLRRIDILSHRKYEDLFDNRLVKYGIPRVYVLTRVDDTACPYLQDQLESVARQDYPNIKSIVLIDKEHTSPANQAALEKFIEKLQKQGQKIQYSYSKGTGPAELSYETRQIFINYATDKDISICLDSDDLFASTDSVSKIVTKINATRADICIIGFETFGNTYQNFAKNYHNDLVKQLAGAKKAVTPLELLDKTRDAKHPEGMAHLISTLGWVKCYRKQIARVYQQLLSDHSKDFKEFPKYEDFPDIVALLNEKTLICAVDEASILFRKREGSVTSKVKAENYDKFIPFHLHLAGILADACTKTGAAVRLADGARNCIYELFIPYKFVQYLNVVYSKTVLEEKESEKLAGYSCNQFYHRFAELIYKGNNIDGKAMSEDVFRAGIIRIINDNRNNKIFDDFPAQLAEYLKNHKLEESEFHIVAEAYGIVI